MIKPFSLLSISAIALLSTTQAYSHVLCAPNNPQLHQSHSHNQVYKVPRIGVVQQNQQKHLQAQRARQQKALANQQRINQQRRAQALAKQQQAKARKNALIQQQRLAAQRAQAARQKAALAASRQAKTQIRQAASKPVYYQPAPVQTVRYVQQPVYRAPAPTRVYSPASAYVSVQVSSGVGRHHQPIHHNVQTHSHSKGSSYRSYRHTAQPRHIVRGHHLNRGSGRMHGHQGRAVYFGSK